MKSGITTWFAAAAFAGLAIALSSAGSVVAQPPGRGPAGPGAPGPGGPGRGGPPNVEEMFSRMDRNNDGKLTKDEVPGPVWERLSNADTDGDGGVTKDEAAKAIPGRRPDGARPDGPRQDGDRPDARRPDGARPDAPRPDGPRPDGPRPDGRRPDGDRPDDRRPNGARPDGERPAPPRSPNQPDRERSGQPDDARRGTPSFGPDAFFDRLDKNHDGNLSRDEFKAVAQLHRGPGAPGGPNAFGGPGGPPMAHRGPDMRGGGPPWARGDRGNFFGPQRFQGGPPWARSGHGPQANSRFGGPPWAHSAQRPQGPRDGGSPQGPPHHDGESRDHHPRDDQRSPSRQPDPRHRGDVNAPQSDASPSDSAVATLPL